MYQLRWLTASNASYNVCATELFLGNVEHTAQLSPVDHICFDEDGAWIAGVLVYESLSFGTQGKVSNYYIAVTLKEQLREAVVDALDL